MRHTFAASSIAASVPTCLIALQMGKSVEQIEKTYGHLLSNAADLHTRAVTGRFRRPSEASGQVLDTGG
jgi:hypothetical protein